MHIESIRFQLKSSLTNWEIESLDFYQINLLAGKNASGKTRVLNSIFTLVHLMRGGNIIGLEHLEWSIVFGNGEKKYHYSLEIKNYKVLFEELKIDGETYFSRDKEGRGTIKYETQIGLELAFEIETTRMAIAIKRDKIQHPSLEALFHSINSLYIFNFGNTLGKYTFYDAQMGKQYNDTDVVYRFKKGLEKYGDEFKRKVIEDFNSLGYSIGDISFQEFDSNKFALYIVENGTKIHQDVISQGMFRALSLIIQIIYIEFKLDSTAIILIDDIGEGLDFERANNLIRYLIKNVKNFENKIQLIMTTNDRLVMNHIPLEYWIIVERDERGKIHFYSQKTHGEIFNKFKRIGLNNFDFFTSEYYKEIPKKNS